MERETLKRLLSYNLIEILLHKPVAVITMTIVGPGLLCNFCISRTELSRFAGVVFWFSPQTMANRIK